jgi:hypothetical protein
MSKVPTIAEVLQYLRIIRTQNFQTFHELKEGMMHINSRLDRIETMLQNLTSNQDVLYSSRPYPNFELDPASAPAPASTVPGRSSWPVNSTVVPQTEEAGTGNSMDVSNSVVPEGDFLNAVAALHEVLENNEEEKEGGEVDV